MPPTLNHAALVAIDMQRGFDFPPWGERSRDDFEDNGRMLLAAWRRSAKPLLHVKHDSIHAHSSLHVSHVGNEFRAGFAPQASEPLIAKSVNCAFIGTDLELRLRRAHIDTVVLFGISTDMCVSTTARIASNLGFVTILVSDASCCFALNNEHGDTIGARTIEAAHLATLRTEFATVTTTEEVIASLSTQSRREQDALETAGAA
jgi:nicotinamidase-related amidase